MTGFDHQLAGTSEAAWTDALAGLPELTAPGRPLVVLAAHPDDETLGAGGLVSTAARRSAAITLVVATDGEASHPASTTHSPGQLAAIRRREVTAAVARLAPAATLRLLGLPDGGLAECGNELDAELDDALTKAPAGALLVAPYRGDRHPDHEACGRAAVRAAARHGAELWEYPIWLWHWGDPASDDLPPHTHAFVLDDTARQTKREALAAHVSQHADLSPEPGDEAILPPSVLAHFDRPVEPFVIAAAAANFCYFDELYARRSDPWGLDDRFYEQRKRDVLLAALPRARFGRVFEPGCATGALTERLLLRADAVVACDVADAAVTQASQRLGDAHGLSLGLGRIPEDWPPGTFDLIVLSEVGYYCPDLSLLHHRVLASLTDDGVLIGCHWRHPAKDHPHTAAAVHDAIGRGLHRDVHHLEADFVLDVWSRAGRSVAQRDGIW